MADGAAVLGVDRNDVALKTLADSSPEGAVVPLLSDLADLDPVEALAAEHRRVAVVANVAGHLRFGGVEESGVAELTAALRVMVEAPWILAITPCPTCARTAGAVSSTSPRFTGGST